MNQGENIIIIIVCDEAADGHRCLNICSLVTCAAEREIIQLSRETVRAETDKNNRHHKQILRAALSNLSRNK